MLTDAGFTRERRLEVKSYNQVRRPATPYVGVLYGRVTVLSRRI